MRPPLRSRESFFHRLPPEPRLLSIRLRSLGDVVLMTPLLESIWQVRSDAQIDVAVEHPYSEALYDNPFIHQLIEIQNSNRSSSSRPENPLLTRTEAIRRIRRTHYDLVWNLHGGATSAWLTGLSGSPLRVGCATFRHRFIYNVRVPDSAELLGGKRHHTVERSLAWFDWLNGEHRKHFDKAPPLTVVVSEQAIASSSAKMERAGVNPRIPYVVIQPAAVFDTKQWMADRFAAVADFIVNSGFQVVLTGGPSELETLKAVQTQMGEKCGLLSDLTVRELIAVIRGSHLYLGNDSGPAHIAAALKKPTVVLFGSSNSAAWSPWKTVSRVVQNPFECNPCPGYQCLMYAQPECIRSITVEQVKEAVRSILS